MNDHIPRIIIKPVEPMNQRYDTCGDYIYDREDDTLTIFVNKMSDWRSELAVVIHELFESIACLKDGIDFMKIDRFDVNFETERQAGLHSSLEEPGDSKDAPYHVRHVSATAIEKSVCEQLNLDWQNHEENVNFS